MSHIHKAFSEKLSEIERLRASLKEAIAKIRSLEKKIEQMEREIENDSKKRRG